jgi:hypothetical protein
MINKIFLARKLKVIIPDENLTRKISTNKSIIATMIKNIETLGYILSKDIIKSLNNHSVGYIKDFYNNLINYIKEMIGAHVKYNPMYPGFPEQVMTMDEAELYINAIMHYIDSIALGTPDPWLPEYPVEKRPKLKDNVKLKVIELGTKEEFNEIFKNLFNAKVALSPADKFDIEWFIKENWRIVIDLLPDVFSNKENLAFIVSKLKNYEILTDKILSQYFKTATDVLRLITALSEGDVSLASNSKFKKFKRSDRKLFLRILENCVNPNTLEEDMLRFKNKWIRIGEIIHPGEYKSKYPKVFKAFDKIRNNKKIETFNSKIEKYFKTENKEKLLELVSTRPGEFARKLDRMLRIFKRSSTSIINGFDEISEKISTTVLLQVREHFLNRNNEKYRIFFPKGNIAKGMLINNNLPKLNEEICDAIVSSCNKTLRNSFKKLSNLNKVWIDEDLKKCPVPFALRSASKSLRTVTKGTRLKLDKGNTIRLFLHWKNLSSQLPSDDKIEDNDGARWYYSENTKYGKRVDLDLSAAFFDKNFKLLERIAYYDLRNENYKACHSGDITSAPRGASEFIDIDIPSALEYGARYVVTNINCFTGQKLKDIPECFAGAMIRQKNKSGEIYDPKTVKYKFDLTADALVVVPMIFDLQENEIIWCDISIDINKSITHCFNNLDNNITGITAMGKAFTELHKPNLYDLFKLHAKARGKIVENKKEADVIFGVYEGDVTPFDIDKIISEYL